MGIPDGHVRRRTIAMRFRDVYIPYGGYWTTPFARWQGSFSSLHPIRFAAESATRALGEREIPLDSIDSLWLGTTVPSRHGLYGAPWLAGMMGMEGVTGPTVSQACATSVRGLAGAGSELDAGGADTVLAVMADRTGNGPHIYYPNPKGPGGTGESEDWVMDSFGHDPHARSSMVQTAENVAREFGIERAAQEELTLMRHAQYQRALEKDRAFQNRYMLSDVEIRAGRKVVATVSGDEGVFPSTAAGLAKLKPMLEEGTVTFGTQTYPADGNAGVVLTRRERARELSRGSNIEVQVLAAAQARVSRGMMPMANVPAVHAVLERAELTMTDVKCVTTHSPFAVNDLLLSRELEIDVERMNRYGCSLIWGHPQGPTGLRSILELIEELAEVGGGIGLFTGCAAGDSAAALVLKVTTG
jgi:acetyl-CoA acetyltransferase